MIKKVVKSSTLYGRIKLEMRLQPLSVPEVCDFFGGRKSVREICDLYMFCGGVPEYLLQIDPAASVSENIARHALCKDGYFVSEFDRIFKDIFREERIYKKIVLLLSRYRSLKVPEMVDLLKVAGGGGFVEFLDNLESAGFVKSVVPLGRPEDSKLKRYRLDDEYLLFYFKFIHPNVRKIRENTDVNRALSFLAGQSYKSWAGFAFERLCLKHVEQLMKSLKIDQLVKNYGAYFDRGSNIKEGVQIDLLFERHDPVVTLCEMKYSSGLIGRWIIDEVERKAALLDETKKTVEKVLITTNGVTRDLKGSNYFSRVILVDELFASPETPGSGAACSAMVSWSICGGVRMGTCVHFLRERVPKSGWERHSRGSKRVSEEAPRRRSSWPRRSEGSSRRSTRIGPGRRGSMRSSAIHRVQRIGMRSGLRSR